MGSGVLSWSDFFTSAGSILTVGAPAPSVVGGAPLLNGCQLQESVWRFLNRDRLVLPLGEGLWQPATTLFSLPARRVSGEKSGSVTGCKASVSEEAMGYVISWSLKELESSAIILQGRISKRKRKIFVENMMVRISETTQQIECGSWGYIGIRTSVVTSPTSMTRAFRWPAWETVKVHTWLSIWRLSDLCGQLTNNTEVGIWSARVPENSIVGLFW